MTKGVTWKKREEDGRKEAVRYLRNQTVITESRYPHCRAKKSAYMMLVSGS